MSDEVMFGEPSTWNMKVGEFIETQLPKQKPKELLDLQEQNRKQRLLDSLQKIGPGLMDESLDFIRRKELKYGGTFKDYINREDKYEDLSFEEWLREDKAEGGRIGFKSGTPFQITDEVLEKIDDLIKNTNLDLKTIGKQIGFGTDKKPMDSKSKVFQEYIKKYGRPDQERLQTRGVKLTADSPYVKKVIKLREELGSTNAVAKELGKENKTIRNVLSKFRPDLMGERNVPGPETGAKAIKKRAQEAIKEAKKKAGPKTTKQADTVINKILDKNKEYAAMSADDLAQDKNFLKRLRLKINPNSGAVDFTGYTETNPVRGKVFNDIELAQHAIDKAKKGELITPDHITPKAKRKQNVGYPINFQPATYMENSQFENARKFLINNPDADARPIDDYLKSNMKTIRFDNKKFGYDGGIVFDSETGTQTLVDKPGLEAGKLKDPMAGTKGFMGGPEMAKAAGKGLLTTLKVLGQPSVAAGFAVDEARKGNIKTAGASLLAPELVGSFAPKGRGLLSLAGRIAANPFGKAARAFTPVGLATIGAGALYDVYKEYERRQALTDEERLEEDIERDRAADEMMVGAAEGGRISLKDGPDKKGLKSPSRRNFLKTTGKLAGIAALLPFGIGKGIKMVEKAAPVVNKGFKLGMDKLMILVDKIKLLGKDVTPKYGTKEREQVTLYQGKDGSTYELSEDLTTGDIRVVRDQEGMASYGDETYDTIQDRSEFMISKGQADETTKGKKPPDEYEEGRAVFDQDGTVADIDDVDDEVIKAIEDEIN